MKLSDLDSEDANPVVIFYGGEPLVNFPVLVHIAERFNALRTVEKCIKNVELSMVTNGLLLTEERILKLKELGVSIAISCDGFTDAATFWVGPRSAKFPDRKPIIRWLPPIPIGMDWGRELPTNIHIVLES